MENFVALKDQLDNWLKLQHWSQKGQSHTSYSYGYSVFFHISGLFSLLLMQL